MLKGLRARSATWWPTEAHRLVRNCLLLLAGVFVVAFSSMARVDLYTGRGLATSGLVALCSGIGITLCWVYYGDSPRREALLRFINRHAILLLALWILALLAWCGRVLFANPYRHEINSGDGAFFSQTLWNLSHGLRPETSLMTLNGVMTPGDDPRYSNAYGYVSLLSLHQYWLPMALLTPLYALYPHPPMHLFALQVCVLAIGVPGVFWAARCANGSRAFALGAAVSYSALPQVGTQLFFLGYMDVVGLAIVPWFCGALFCRNHKLLYVFAFLTALISFPFAAFVVLAGVAVFVIPGERRAGLVVTLIGLAIMKVDSSIMSGIISAYPATKATTTSFLKTYVFDRTIASLTDVVRFNALYVVFLFQTVVFLPLLALWRQGRLNMTILALFILLGLAFVPMMFRSYGWQFQRNSFFIVPVFMLGMVAALALRDDLRSRPDSARQSGIPAMILFVGILPAIILGNPFDSGPLRSHYPWGRDVSIVPSPETQAWDRALRQFEAIVPDTASVAWAADPAVAAVLTSRQHSWSIGREPSGVRYYAFVGDPSRADGKGNVARWYTARARLRVDTTFRVVYDGNPGQPILVFENLHSTVIPRNQNLLGWSVVMRPLAISRRANRRNN